MERSSVAGYLLITATAYILGSLFFGFMGDRLARSGISRMTTYKAGLAACVLMFGLLAAQVTGGLGVILAVYGFTAIAGALAYPLMTALFGPEMTGRVNTASNVLMFGVSFAFQWGIGAVLRLFPVEGHTYSTQGYATAFLILAALQVAALLWVLPLRDRTPATAG
jgi:MFS family permease